MKNASSAKDRQIKTLLGILFREGLWPDNGDTLTGAGREATARMEDDAEVLRTIDPGLLPSAARFLIPTS